MKRARALLAMVVAGTTIVCLAGSGSAATAATAVTVEEIVGLESVAFLEATHHLLYQRRLGRRSPSLSELWSLLDRWEIERGSAEPTSQRVVDHGYLVEAISSLGGDRDQKKLLGIYRKLPPDSPYIRAFLKPLWGFRIRKQLQALAQAGEPIELDLPVYEEPLPPELQDATKELQHAWRSYKAVLAAFDGAVRRSPGEGWIGVQDNWALFYESLGGALAGESEGASRALSRFGWSGWCGTGSSWLYEPQYRALFSELLRERQLEAALGAMLRLLQTESIFGPWQAGDEWRRQFVELCGADWELLWVGALLDGQRFAAPALARHGSVRSARLLLAIANLPGVGERQDYLQAIAGLVETGEGAPTSIWFERSKELVIPDDLQQRLLGVLHRHVRPDVDPGVLETVVGQLARLGRHESRDALRQALQLPFEDSRKRARETLLALGESVEELVPIPGVGFRLSWNGQPLAETRVAWEIETDSGRVGSTASTDANGRLELRRKHFGAKQGKVRLTAEMPSSIDDRWFRIELNTPADPTEETDVRLDGGVASLRLVDRREARFRGRGPLRIAFARVGAEPWGMSEWPISELSVEEATAPIALPALQTGVYRIRVQAPGAARWESPEIQLGPGATLTDVVLEPGVDVRFEIVTPRKDRGRSAAAFTLVRRADSVSQQQYYQPVDGRYSGLPRGDYLLRIESSVSLRERMKRHGQFDPGFVDWLGEEIAVTVESGSPQVIDLGRIQLRQAPADPTVP